MKLKNSLLVLASLATMTAFSMISCSESKNIDPDSGNEYDFSPIISAYVDNVVMPTYADMKNKAKILFESIRTFNDAPSSEKLAAAATAWLNVREPWEKSEAFLFGPCGDNGLNVDPMIDTWPFDMAEFTNKINGTVPLTPEAVSVFTETTRGFHTIEYLIFKEGNPKDISINPLSAREMEYLESAATILYYDCVRLWLGWNGTVSGLSADDQGVIDDMEAIDYWNEVEDYLYNYNGSYSATFKGAKRPYTGQIDVIEEMIYGISDIAVEVAENKIALPASENDVTLVESHYAYNSLVDFVNNINSIENAYYGSLIGMPVTNSLATFVKSREGGAAIDAEIVAAIANAKAKINAITYPFTLNLNDTQNIQAATAACMDINDAILKVLTLF